MLIFIFLLPNLQTLGSFASHNDIKKSIFQLVDNIDICSGYSVS